MRLILQVLLYQIVALFLYIFFLCSYIDVLVLLVLCCRILCFVDRASLYNLVNRTNLVHSNNNIYTIYIILYI